jgi:hypothetical protein
VRDIGYVPRGAAWPDKTAAEVIAHFPTRRHFSIVEDHLTMRMFSSSEWIETGTGECVFFSPTPILLRMIVCIADIQTPTSSTSESAASAR